MPIARGGLCSRGGKFCSTGAHFPFVYCEFLEVHFLGVILAEPGAHFRLVYQLRTEKSGELNLGPLKRNPPGGGGGGNFHYKGIYRRVAGRGIFLRPPSI